MARKNPISDRDKLVAKRLQEVRWINHLSAAKCALTIGVTSVSYANYEYGRVPLPYSVGDKFCRHFDVSQKWLASGSDIPEGFIPIPKEVEAEIPARATFTDAYDRFVQPVAELHLAAMAKWRAVKDANKLPPEERAVVEQRIRKKKDDLLDLIDGAFENANYAQRWELIDVIEYDLREYAAAHPDVIEFHDLWGTPWVSKINTGVTVVSSDVTNRPRKSASKRKSDVRYSLTSKAEVVSSAPAMIARGSHLDSLMSDVRALTEERGAKAQLARSFGVTPQAVSEWLSGASAPAAEMALRLQEWVRMEKLKQKSPGSAQTRPEQRTRRKKSNAQRPKSSPP